MKTTITSLIVVAAWSFSNAMLAAGEMESKAQPVPETTTEQAAPTHAPQSAVKSPTPAKGKPRPKNLDLRHCLDLKTDAEITKCAGE